MSGLDLTMMGTERQLYVLQGFQVHSFEQWTDLKLRSDSRPCAGCSSTPPSIEPYVVVRPRPLLLQEVYICPLLVFAIVLSACPSDIDLSLTMPLAIINAITDS